RDNFFELGGDSILSIQVIARANQAGIRITPRDIFQHPTIEGLAAVAGSGPVIQAEQGLVTGEVPLTPIQHWFFELNLPNPHHWNQSIILSVNRQLDWQILQQVVAAVQEHHDMLRLRFKRTEKGWSQYISDDLDFVPFEYVDLSDLGEKERREKEEQLTAWYQSTLNLLHGPAWLFAYFDEGPDAPGKIFITVHHLAMDGVSWRILLEDIQLAYQQLSAGQKVQLPPKTTSYKYWAQKLQEYARSEDLLKEAEYWTRLAGRKVSPLVPDNPEGDNSEASSQEITVSLNPEDTQVLLQESPRTYRTHISEILLAALVRAYHRWTQQRRLLVELEGHGREDLFPDVNISRTVGWFTSLYPVILEAPVEEDMGAVIRAVKEELRAIPERGIGFGILRYLCPDETIRQQLKKLPHPPISFNYLGQFNQGSGEGAAGLFGGTDVNKGPDRDPGAPRTHLIDIIGNVSGNRLQFVFIYSGNQFQKKRMETFARLYIEALRDIVEHSLQTPAPAFTPSDFPLARLNQEALDRILKEPRQVEDIYPLTPMQQGMLFHYLLAPQSGIYVEQLSATLKGKLDMEAFRRAWEMVLKRHSILRTGFVWEGLEEPHQVVYREAKIPVEVKDWRSVSPEDRQQRLLNFLNEQRRRGFDLHQPPLMRVHILQLEADTVQLVWTYHHLLVDGWAVPILLNELFTLYQAYQHGEDISLPPPRPFRDYIAWLQRQDLQEAESFWKNYLKGFQAPTPLIQEPEKQWDRQPEEISRKEELRLSRDLTRRLNEIARKHQLTLNTLIQGAWALLLSRYSGEKDVVFGATTSGRPADLAGSDAMVGIFINTLPVRVQIAPEESVADWLKRLQENQAEIRQYEYTPLVRIQQWSDVPPDLPLFQTLVVFENYPVSSTVGDTQGDLQVIDILTREQTNFPITLGVLPGDVLQIEAVYDIQRFSPATIKRMLGHYQRILQQLAEDLERPLAHVDIVTPREYRQVVEGWNNTARKFSEKRCIHELFEKQVTKTPDAVALVFRQSTLQRIQLSYKELNEKANQLAHYLISLGVRSETVVGVSVEKSVEMVVAILAILKAGGAYLPLDPKYPDERLFYMLEDAGVPVLLTKKAYASRFEDFEGTRILLDAQWDEIEKMARKNPDVAVFPDNLAYVIYTSGSTGKPKGTMIQHRGLVNLVQAQIDAFGIRPDSRVLQFASFSFDASVSEIFITLCRGARLYLTDEEWLTFGETFVDMLQVEMITKITLPPSVLAVLPDAKLPHLKTIVSAGEACPPELVQRWAKGRRFINAYGPTENTVCATVHPVKKAPDGTNVPIGKPIANVQVYIVDENLNLQPVGVPGELCIAGVGLARGYLNQPDLTAEKFVPNPFSKEPGSRLYRTGDLARYLPDGTIEFLGRIDHQVKVRGFRIELGEIEATLAGHPAVKEAVVVARDDAGGEKRLVAYFIPATTPGPAIDDLQQYLKQYLPDYMVPSVFVEMETFPLTPNGKIDRRRLPEPGGEAVIRKEFVPPRDALELKLVRLWEEVLNVRPIGIRDNFFDLGGHSLLALRLITLIQERFQKEVPLVTLVQEPTIEKLAELLREEQSAREEKWSPLIKLWKGKKPTGEPTLYIVHPSGGSVHWYAELGRLLGSEFPVYGIQAKGLTGKQPIHTEIEEMATAYVEAIRKRQPEGPYHIAGWSLGVIIAYEMAQQLVAMGQSVAFLGMLDQGPYLPDDEPEDEAEMLVDMFRRYFDLSVDELRAMDSDARFKFVLKKAKKAKILPRFITQAMFKNYIRIIQTQTEAWRRYKHRPYPGKITVVVSDEHANDPDLPLDLGWKELAEDGVEILRVPGDHLSMMTDPHVQQLAEQIRKALKR
ncbi:MAG: amino acid adenylation domain-containing protein, partial [Calditrichaeota bacterium]|nr:amino acid adenylation domain-containing protein [Calditrichota bacterium]